MDPLLAFGSGIGVSLASALIAHLLTRSREQRRQREQREFEIYMKLLDLHTTYFWFTVAELRGTPVSAEIRAQAFKLSWQIADLLRIQDDAAYLGEILEVILGSRFDTAVARHDAMGEIADRLAKRVNPRYVNSIREVTRGNFQTLAPDKPSNAPGVFHW